MKISACNYKSAILLIVTCCWFSCTSGQAAIHQNDSIHSAGYKEYKAVDSSRRYKTGAVKGDPLFYRPEEIDVWYPSQINSDNKPLDYRYFLSLFERRANTFQDSVKYNGLADELMKHFTIAGGGSNMLVKTKSYLDAQAKDGSFPLIIYMSSYNGMSYENVPLFENLASHGYIVMSISSIGRYPGNMTTKYPDVLEQVKDAEFALRLIGTKNIDTSKIGVIGYSYGGVAAALLAMKNRSIKAVLSLDGSEMHYYGREREEDKDFDTLRRSKYFSPPALNGTYAYLESNHKSEDGIADSIYHIPLPAGIKKYYARLIGAEHEDFSCISSLALNEGSTYNLVNKLTLEYFDQLLKNSDHAFDSGIASSLASKKISEAQTSATRKTGQLILTGQIISAKDNTPLAYANIGIPSGNCGTVSGNDGRFSLKADDTLADRMIRISSLGYEPKIVTVRELAALLSRQPVIKLNEQINQLKEVTIHPGKTRIRIIGNTSQSKFFNVGFPLRDLGSEVCIRVSLDRKKVRLRSFNYNISATRLDSCTFRLNVYGLKNGMPAENLLTQNVISGIGSKPGRYTIDLTPYHILLSGPVFISLEWISGKTSAGHGAVFFSAGLLSSSYHRKTSEADWVKFKGLGAAFNLEVEEE